jgi:transcriptional regulator with XRE-family HTH domain
MDDPSTVAYPSQLTGSALPPLRVQQPGFGKRLRSARLDRGMSQRVLATGVVSPSYISHLESGMRVPTLDVVVHLAERLGVHPDHLVGTKTAPQAGAPADAESMIRAALQPHDERGLDDTGVTVATAAADFERARVDGDTVAFVRSGMRLQALLRSVDETARRGAVLDEVSEAVAAAGHAGQLGPITVDRAAIARDLGRPGQAVELLDRAAQQLAADPSAGTAQRVRLHAIRLSVLSDLDRTDEVQPAIEMMLEAAEHVSDPGVVGRVRWTASIAYARIGDRAEALRYLDLAKSSLDGSISVADWIRFSRTAAQVLLECGEAEQALAHIEDARRTTERLGLVHHDGQVRLLDAQYHLLTGDHATARSEALALLGGPEVPAGYDLQRLRWVAADAARRVEDTDTAVAQLRLIAAEAEDRGAYRAASRALHLLDEVRSAR